MHCTLSGLCFIVCSVHSQVQALYKECGNNGASCNCAVMVRSHDDVVVIDRCSSVHHTNGPPLDVRLYLNGELTPGTSIKRFVDGKKYRVWRISSGCCSGSLHRFIDCF